MLAGMGPNPQEADDVLPPVWQTVFEDINEDIKDDKT